MSQALPHEYRLDIGPAIAVQPCKDAFFGVVKAYGWDGPVQYAPQSRELTIVRSQNPMPDRLRQDLEDLKVL